MQSQPIEWGKIFAIWTTDKGIMLETKNKSHKSVRIKDKPIVKCAKDLSRHFTEEDIQTANEYVKSTLLSIFGEINIKRNIVAKPHKGQYVKD